MDIANIDETYNNFKNKIEELNNSYPNLSKLWLCYLKKHTLLYKKVLTDITHVIENIHLQSDLTENNILMLYLILNNNINSIN
jgi:hypothetical protein